MNVKFYTLGCKVNQYETEAVKELFLKNGFECDDRKDGDVIIINTCTVTAESDRKSRQLLRKLRRESPDAIIVLTGCMVQAFPESAECLPEADIIIGNKNPQEIIDKVSEFKNNRFRISNVTEHLSGESFNPLFIDNFSERTRAYMKIEDGCDRFCSYCIIPKARGRVRSRSLTDIKREAISLSQNGYKEIVLVGINLSAYGNGFEFNLCDAVDTVAEVGGIERVRLGSLEPDHISDEMLERFKNQPKFCPQFHLSLQSGCDETLKRMNRHYDSNFYLDLVNRIHKIFTDASITTDIMVGFAGETEEEFKKSVLFAEKIGFARMHIFAYSRRLGTVAAALKNQVSNKEKAERSKIMCDTARNLESRFLSAQIGKVFPVLFETGVDGIFEGYTPNYSKVSVKSSVDLKGRILPVKITDSFDDYCIGEII